MKQSNKSKKATRVITILMAAVILSVPLLQSCDVGGGGNPATEPVTESATEPATAPATEPTTEPVTAPATEPVNYDIATAENLDGYLALILDDIGTGYAAIYKYVRRNMEYKMTKRTDITDMAVHSLNYGTGACYHYASLCYVLLQAAGYEVIFVDGAYLEEARVHSWVMVKTPEGWFHFDPLHSKYLRTDLEVREYGFIYDAAVYPATPAVSPY